MNTIELKAEILRLLVEEARCLEEEAEGSSDELGTALEERADDLLCAAELLEFYELEPSGCGSCGKAILPPEDDDSGPRCRCRLS